MNVRRQCEGEKEAGEEGKKLRSYLPIFIRSWVLLPLHCQTDNSLRVHCEHRGKECSSNIAKS